MMGATLETARHDVRLAVRSLRATPIVSTVAVLSLALAIGANSAIFSIVDSLILRTLPVTEPERLVLVTDSDPSRLRPWTYPLWQELRRPTAFQNVAAWSFTRFNLASGGETDLVNGMWASASLFETLDVPALIGRTPSAADDRRGGGPDGAVAVISHAFWQRRYGGAVDAVGRQVRLNSVPFTIGGVMPPSFTGPDVGRSFDVIVPLEQEPLIRGTESVLDEGGSNFLSVIARLAPGQSLESATAELRQAQPAIREATLGYLSNVSPEVLDRYMKSPLTLLPAATGFSTLRGRYQRPLLTVMAVVAIVLLIACVNIANLLLARATARRHELSVRRALGASRLRLARQLITESLVLSGAGAVLGLAFAMWGSRTLVARLSTTGNIVALDLPLDVRVMAFTLVIAVLTTVLFGTVPALRATRVAPADVLKERGQTGGAGRGGFAAWLVVVQVALSMVLAVAAGLFVQSFLSLATRDLGFESDRVLVVTLETQQTGIDPSQRVQVFWRVREAVAALPHVAGAAVSFLAPFGGGFTPAIAVSGAPLSEVEIFGNLISPGWFRTYGVRIVAGRDLTERDRSGAPRVALVNEAFARLFAASGSPLGRTIVPYAGTAREMPPMEIVGVVADAVHGSVRAAATPTWYAPIELFDVPGLYGMLATVRLSVRPASGTPSRLTRSVAAAAAAVEPRLSLTARPLQDMVNASIAQDRLTAILAGAFGALALLLAGLGLYGLATYSVARRRSEIGIRMAIGASPAAVVRLVFARLLGLVAAGIVIGTAASAWASALIGALIYGLAPRDPATLACAAAVIALVTALAGWLPARRAARLDPVAALRA